MKRFIEFFLSIFETAIIFSGIALSVLLICAALFTPKAKADCGEIYTKVGAGYILEAANTMVINGKTYEFNKNTPFTARFELGVDCGILTYGVAHYSQWMDGKPFNERKEYYRTEFFVDYKFSWGL